MGFLQRFAYRLQCFMAGRYGVDQLTVALLVFGLLISFSLSIAGLFPWYLLSWIPYGFAIYRMLSRRTDARRRENAAFLKVWGPVAAWFRLRREAFRNRKVYRYFRCPHCGLHLRAPRGRGKIQITCQRCHEKFIRKT